MVEFCCCNLKPKSFYLLMIFVSCAFFITGYLDVSMAALSIQQFAFIAVIGWLLILAVVYHQIISIIAFIHYVVYDSIKYKYCHFYVNSMHILIYILAGLHVTFFIAFIANVGRTPGAVIIASVIYFVIAIALLVCMFFFSRRLLDVMPKEDEINHPIEDSVDSEKPAANEKTAENTKTVDKVNMETKA